MGIDAVAGLFTSLGYVEASDPGKLGDGPMRFPEKKVSARWFRPPDATPPLPRIFISELDVSDLSNAARATIEAYVGGTGDGEHGMLFSTQSASAALPYDTIGDVRRRMEEISPTFARVDDVQPSMWLNGATYAHIGAKESKIDASEAFGTSVTNFYMTDAISRASATMAKCTKAHAAGAP